MAKYRITNYGNTRKLPYKGEVYEITRQSFIETDDRDLAEALSSFQFVDMEEVSAVKKAPEAALKTPKVKEGKQPDLSTMSRKELFKLGKKKGIKLRVTLTKAKLIEKLSEGDNLDEQKD